MAFLGSQVLGSARGSLAGMRISFEPQSRVRLQEAWHNSGRNRTRRT